MAARPGSLTPSRLCAKLPRSNTIGSSQRYIANLMENPSTSPSDRRVAIDLVLSEPWRFIPLDEHTGNPMHDEWARKKNAGADPGFVRAFRDRYIGQKSGPRT